MFLKVSRRIYKGIPEKMRGLVWSLLLGIEQESKKNAGVYEVSYVAYLHIKYTHLYTCIAILVTSRIDVQASQLYQNIIQGDNFSGNLLISGNFAVH